MAIELHFKNSVFIAIWIVSDELNCWPNDGENTCLHGIGYMHGTIVVTDHKFASNNHCGTLQQVGFTRQINSRCDVCNLPYSLFNLVAFILISLSSNKNKGIAQSVKSGGKFGKVFQGTAFGSPDRARSNGYQIS